LLVADMRDFVGSRSIRRERWQLRLLNGPECGTTYAVEARLSIGRAEGCDLQLTAQEVSRYHARIVEDEQGRHVLVDLESSNGTYVDGERVRSRVLQADDEITIGDVELVYERAPTSSRRFDVDAIYDAAPPPVMVARRHAPTMPVGVAVPAGAIRDRNGCAVMFEHADGSPYVGNLIADILEYRTLRAQQLRGGFGHPAQAHVFERLGQQLRQPQSSDARLAQRAFRRFGCWLPAHVRLTSGEELPCHVRDVGVDGAQLVVEARLTVDALVRLTVEVIDDGERRTIVLSGRVAWVDGEFLGIAFAGPPRREDGVYAQRSGVPAVVQCSEERTLPIGLRVGPHAAPDPRVEVGREREEER